MKVIILDFASGFTHIYTVSKEWDEDEIEKFITEHENFSLSDIEYMICEELKVIIH